MQEKNKKDVILLSLDTSSTKTGYAIFINGIFQKSGELVSKGVKEARRNDMILRLEKLIKSVHPDIIVIETPSKPQNASTQRILTIIYGACLVFSLQNEIEFVERRPTSSRKNAVLYEENETVPQHRKEIKSWVIDFAKRKTEKDMTDNEADAYVQGLGYVNWWKEQERNGKIS